MELTWYGHAAFLLQGERNDSATVRVVLDPYQAPLVGTYAPIDDTADLVALSHENEKYHSFVDTIKGPNQTNPVVVDGLQLLQQTQPQTVLGVPFTAVRVWENEARQEPIAMVGLTLSQIRILHMGDCGHALSTPEVAACGPVDVLLALAGGPPTLPLTDLIAFIHALKPRIVIPMHFGNEKINLNLQPIGDFLNLLPSELVVRQFETPTISITNDTLPTTTEVWVLPPAR